MPIQTAQLSFLIARGRRVFSVRNSVKDFCEWLSGVLGRLIFPMQNSVQRFSDGLLVVIWRWIIHTGNSAQHFGCLHSETPCVFSVSFVAVRGALDGRQCWVVSIRGDNLICSGGLIDG